MRVGSNYINCGRGQWGQPKRDALARTIVGLVCGWLALAAPSAKAARAFFDSFTDQDGALLSQHQDEAGAKWSFGGGTDAAQIKAGRVCFPGHAPYGIYIAATGWPDGTGDVVAKVHCFSPAGSVFITGRTKLQGGAYTTYDAGIATGAVRLESQPGNNVIASVPFDWRPGRDYEVRLSLAETTQKIYIDGELAISCHDSAIATGPGSGAGLFFGPGASDRDGFHIDAFFAGPLHEPGVTTVLREDSGDVKISNTAVRGDTGEYTLSYQRAEDREGRPGEFSNLESMQATQPVGTAPPSATDTHPPSASRVWYRCRVEFADGTVETSGPVKLAAPLRPPAEFYLSANGKDTNDGKSPMTAWKSIARVNTEGLAPGDTVLFRAGDNFPGNLIVHPAVQPDATHRITIGSYGSGAATISPGPGYGIKLQDCGYVTVKNLIIAGPGVKVSGSFPQKKSSTVSTAAGVTIELNDNTSERCGLVLDHLAVSGCLKGIEAGSSLAAPTVGFDGLRISRCAVRDCASLGIAVWGNFANSATTPVNRFVRIEDCAVYNIRGNTVEGGGSGFPIVLFCAADSVVDRCVTFNCGEAQNPTARNGVCGPLFSHAQRCVMRSCESYDMHSPQAVDGNAFDLDADCHDCVIEYCYGHDCDGSVVLLWNDDAGATSSNGSVVRYNIFVAGSRGSDSNGGSIFSSAGAAGEFKVYQNTFYQKRNAVGVTALINVHSGGAPGFYNNVFSVAGGEDFGQVGGATLLGNFYDVRAGSTFRLAAGEKVYSTLTALHEAGYERLDGVDTGAAGDPKFRAPGETPVIMPEKPVSALAAYDLAVDSAARGAGVDLRRVGLPVPLVDWHGAAAIGGEDAQRDGFDAGAVHSSVLRETEILLRP